MTIKDNNKPNRIYLKSTKQWVEVPEDIYREINRSNDAFRKREQYHGRCACPKSKFWLCDTDCGNCELVEGRSNRKYTDENAVANAVTSAGFDPYEHKVLGVTAMTRLLGKAKFEELLGGLIEKPQGKPTLVLKSDKRPAIKNNAEKAAEDFKEDK